MNTRSSKLSLAAILDTSIGRLHVLATVIMTVHLQPPMEFADPPDIYAIQRDGAVEIVWEVGHLRVPAAFSWSVKSDELCILVDVPQNSSHLAIDWSATSTNVNGVMEGVLGVPLAERRIFLDQIEHNFRS